MSELLPLPDIKFAPPVTPAAISGRRGDLQWLALDSLFIDHSYQRDLGAPGRANIRKIVENFAWHLFSPLIVAQREDGQFAVIDGQHRAIAAKMHGAIGEVPCLIIHCTRSDEAKAFSIINGNVTKVTAQYLFRARIASGDVVAVGANRAAQAAGVRILTVTASAATVKFNETQACATIETFYKSHGEAILTEALSLIVRAANGQRGVLRSSAIAAFCDVLRDNAKWRENLKQAVSIIADYGLAKLLSECAVGSKSGNSGARSGVRYELVRRVTEMLRRPVAQPTQQKVVDKPAPRVEDKPAAEPPRAQGRFYSPADAKRATSGRA